jgi:hypothetical protein
MKNIKRVLFWLIILVVVGIIGILCYVAYIDINCSEAKNYLIDTYDFKKEELHAKKYTEYVYEDIADCNTLWVKKCTDNKNLSYTYEFETKDGKKIIVSEDKDGNFIDDYGIYNKNANELDELLDGAVHEISDEELIDVIMP